MEEFKLFIERLKNAFQNPLPGPRAHRKMLPIKVNPERELKKVNASTKQGSVLILLYPQEGRMYFPLMQRPDYDGVHGGQISLPGGKKEEKDKDYIATAVRETEEEIGVSAKSITVLGSLSELYVSASNIQVLPVVGFCDKTPMFIPNPYEVKEILEVSIDDLLKEREITFTDISVRGNIVSSPYYHLNNRVVWGATAMILSEFVSVLDEMD